MFELFSSLYFIMEGVKMTSEGRSLLKKQSIVLCYCHLTLTVYNSKMLLLNVRRNFSSDQKVFKRLVLPVGDNCRLKIYSTESIALSYNVS